MAQLLIFLATVSSLLSFYIVMTKQSVHAVLTLVTVFILTAIMWFAIEVEYLAIMLVLVYVGAVMVLFLFVVMMVQPADTSERNLEFSFGQFCALTLCLLLPQIFLPGLVHTMSSFVPYDQDYSSVTQLGLSLFSDYLHQFLLAGIILIAAIVAAVGMTFRGPRNRLNQEAHEQLQANKANRLKIIQDEDR